MGGIFLYQEIISILSGERSASEEALETALNDAKSLLTQWWVNPGMKAALEYHIDSVENPDFIVDTGVWAEGGVIPELHEEALEDEEE